MKNFLIISTAVVVVSRCTLPGHGLSYAGTVEALEHIWVGIMITVAFLPTPRKTEWTDLEPFTHVQLRWLAGILLLIATVFETAMFLCRSK